MLRTAVAGAVGAVAAMCVLALAACLVTIDDSLADRADATPGAADGADAPHACPAHMVGVPRADGAGVYCIDATEVTVEAYAAFLQQTGGAPPPSARAECAWNASLEPEGWDASRAGTLPVVGVDWCDALAFCTHHGKRLCGKTGGGAADYESGVLEARGGEWFNACSRGGARVYPYGDTYQPQACLGRDATPRPTSPRAVGQSPACEGGYDGIFDMSGNVHEWLDACTDNHPIASCQTPGPECDLCRSGGGSFGNDETKLRCGGGDQLLRNARYGDTGIRCCADP